MGAMVLQSWRFLWRVQESKSVLAPEWHPHITYYLGQLEFLTHEFNALRAYLTYPRAFMSTTSSSSYSMVPKAPKKQGVWHPRAPAQVVLR